MHDSTGRCEQVHHQRKGDACYTPLLHSEDAKLRRAAAQRITIARTKRSRHFTVGWGVTLPVATAICRPRRKEKKKKSAGRVLNFHLCAAPTCGSDWLWSMRLIGRPAGRPRHTGRSVWRREKCEALCLPRFVWAVSTWLETVTLSKGRRHYGAPRVTRGSKCSGVARNAAPSVR